MLDSLWVLFIISGVSLLGFLLIKKGLLRKYIIKKLFAGLEQPKFFGNKQKISLPFIDNLKEKSVLITPGKVKKGTENLIAISNVHWLLEDILTSKIIFAVILFLLSLFIITSAQILIILKLFYIAAFAALGYFIPEIILWLIARQRKIKIRKELPAFIDYLTICVEAGMGVDIAIFRVIGKLSGPLSEEVAKAMAEIKYGKTKTEAFKNLIERINEPEITAFFNALLSGEKAGIALGKLLKNQSQQIREKRKNEVQERAYKIPVKLVFPLILFILPSLFIVFLGPAVIQIFDSLF